MHDRTFSRLVDRLVVGVAASFAASAVTGCAGLDTDGIEALACAEEGYYPDLLGSVEPAEAFDAMELHAVRGGGPWARGDSEPDLTRGVLCAAASDGAACSAALAAPRDVTGFVFNDCEGGSCVPFVLVATRGDEVLVLDSEADVLAWLGPIDNPVEAAWVARLGGYDVGCTGRRGDDVSGVRPAGAGWDVLAPRVVSSCSPYEKERALVHVDERGTLEVLDTETILSDENMCSVAGRRPQGWRSRSIARCGTPSGVRADVAGGAIGAHLAMMCELEAASIVAFRQLEEELRHHRAPVSLRRAARRARADEVRHAVATRALARRHGATAPRPHGARPAAPRNLRELAVDNAREGCAREAYGAVVARWQSLHATDAGVRTALGRIARDESRHAAFSLRLDRWLRTRLTAAECQEVLGARSAAFEELRSAVATEPPPALVDALGLPGPLAARALLDGLAESLAAA